MIRRLALALAALLLGASHVLAAYPHPSPLLFKAAVATSTFNPLDKNAQMTLSNGNLTTTWGGSASHGIARGQKFASTGKLYFEIKDVVTGATANGTCIGLAQSAASLSNYLGSAASIGYFNNGTYYQNATGTSGLASYTTGDILNVAVDFTNSVVYFGKNGVYSGNPFAGTGGISISPGSYAPAGDGYDNGTVFTLNTGGSAFSYPIPSGFTAWQ